MSNKIIYKNEEEIELIRKNCLIVSKALARVAELLKPGITSLEIDKAAEEVIRDLGSTPGFKGYGGFPATLCVSYNDIVVHGIPGDYEFKDGDIVSVDCGSFSEGYYGDAAYTFALGAVKSDVLELLRVTRESLYKGIEKAVVGNRLGDIGAAIQDYTEKEKGYSVVRDLVGHGVGQNLHEAPQVPNYGKRGRGRKLREGLVIAIEPMINLGRKEIYQEKDGWTIKTRDGAPSAHFEHTIAVGKGDADILSSHDEVEDNYKKNANLLDF
ncbi:type I methionyl aminopeptidase [Membranicola marinus]|uniref:Methionine aminopeptidase n=1 Tax=Membranihabitans marinus TaxID=1227546 RepID=A0A953LCA2_9BACT|nr:type I methionyl aminopeptidase [Membranihabitans marinus]MBY5959321.1 type I methionyl aminopeptidase [Membranihabitans marinus]